MEGTMKPTTEERAQINIEIERLWNTSSAVLDGKPSKADWTKFERERNRLFKKLGSGCRYCGNEQLEFYMLNGDLWHKVVNVEPGRRCFGAGSVCLSCVTRRLFPRQLYNSDLNDGTGGDAAGFPHELEWEDPETDYQYCIIHNRIPARRRRAGCEGRHDEPLCKARPRCKRQPHVLSARRPVE
jgi:hypothetical protein